MNNEKLTICFSPWLVFFKNEDYYSVIKEIKEREFNCIRFDDGAGLLWDKNGNVRDDVVIRQPFGKYSENMDLHLMVDGERINILDRLLKICRAAKKLNVKLILSSWFFLHTNWFCEECDVTPLFELSTEDKIAFFANELSEILSVLRKEGLIDVVAFAEIFNEFDGLPFASEYKEDMPKDKANRLRVLHEKELEKLKAKHPDVLFAFDTWKPDVQEEIIPRNIDVLNFHSYHIWPVYFAFQKDIVKWTLEEPEIPEETRYYLKENIITVADVMKEMKNIRTGLEWPRRVSLYSSIDYEKEHELAKLLDKELKDNYEHYLKKLYNVVETVMSIHDKVVPNSRIVMGEGVTYCPSYKMTFERDSEAFWEIIKEQMCLFNKKGFWGTIVATSHAPGQISAWECKDRYITVNGLFLSEK